MGNITPNDGEQGDPAITGKDNTDNLSNVDNLSNLPPNDNVNNNEVKKPVEITPEVLEGLNDYAKALRSEFEIANKELSDTTPAEDLQAFWKRHVPNAAAQII